MRNVPKEIPVYCLNEQGHLVEIGSSGNGEEEYIMPQFSTLEAPPEDIRPNEIAQFSFDKQTWDILPKNLYDRLNLEEKKDFDRNVKIQELESFLDRTDYIGNKIIEGESTVEDYASLIQERKDARERIRKLTNGK